jgi:L-threonylcarbamoyladenylate synthase
MSPSVVSITEPRLVVWLGDLLARAGVVAFPTDTIYGLGGDPWNERALARVRALKRRGGDQPFTVHLASVDDVARVARLDERTQGIVARLLPGPYTLLLPASRDAPFSAVRGGKVGVRVPDHPFFGNVLRRVGSPLFGTSANRAGEPPLRSAEEIARAFPEVDLLVSDPHGGRGLPSAILDLTTVPPRAVRGELPKDLG